MVFAIVDLYFAYTAPSCQTTTDAGLGFTLGTWLQVDGYTMIGSTLLAVVLLRTPPDVAVGIVCMLFAVAWTVVGAFLFFSSLPSSCNTPLRNYRSHCVMVQNDKLQSPEDLFLRSFELQKIE